MRWSRYDRRRLTDDRRSMTDDRQYSALWSVVGPWSVPGYGVTSVFERWWVYGVAPSLVKRACLRLMPQR
jgi:hypothetical protein